MNAKELTIRLVEYSTKNDMTISFDDTIEYAIDTHKIISNKDVKTIGQDILPFLFREYRDTDSNEDMEEILEIATGLIEYLKEGEE